MQKQHTTQQKGPFLWDCLIASSSGPTTCCKSLSISNLTSDTQRTTKLIPKSIKTVDFANGLYGHQDPPLQEPPLNNKEHKGDFMMALLNNKTFQAAALGLMLVTTALPAVANEQPTNLNSPVVMYENVMEASHAAAEYALDHDAIGIVISYGEYEGAPPPEAFGERFQEEISKLGEQSAYFIADSDDPGYSMAFHFGRTGEGPMEPNEAAKNLSMIVKTKRAERELFASADGTKTMASVQPVSLDQ